MIIGLCGFIGSGKSTVANIIETSYKDYKSISFASCLKDTISTMFGWDRNLLEGDTIESRQWREQKDEFWSKEFNKDITPRYILQWFATDIVRQQMLSNFWVTRVKKQIIENPGNYVISDVRFLNEINMLHELQY